MSSPFRHKRPGAKVLTLGALTVFAVLIPALRHGHGAFFWMSRLINDHYETRGSDGLPWMLGDLPNALSAPVQAICTIGVLLISFRCAELLWPSSGAKRLSWQSLNANPLFWIFAPFVAAYLILILTRQNVFDRYLLPIHLLCLIWFLRRSKGLTKAYPSLVAIAILVVIAAYGVAGTHDSFAMARAQLAATQEIRAAGIPRKDIWAGFGYDGWTQIELTGFVNEPRIHTPAGAYHPWADTQLTDPKCAYWFSSYVPSVTGRYELSEAMSTCFPASSFSPVRYHAWLSPHDRSVFVLQRVSGD